MAHRWQNTKQGNAVFLPISILSDIISADMIIISISRMFNS